MERRVSDIDDKHYVPGDLVVQRYQRGAKPKLVVATTDDAEIVVAWEAEEQRYHRIFCSAYARAMPADDASRKEAIDHSLSEAYATTTVKRQW